jgi:hypothetical protein
MSREAETSEPPAGARRPRIGLLVSTAGEVGYNDWMKKRIPLGWLLPVSFFLVSSPLGHASSAETGYPRLSLKLMGGFTSLAGRGGDLETLRLDTQAIFQSLPRIARFSSSFDWTGLPAAPEMGVDLILHLGPHIGLSLGSGYIFGSRSVGTYSYSFSTAQYLQGSGYSQDDHADYEQDFSFRAVPIRAGVYVSADFGSFSVYGSGGAELCFVSIDHVYAVAAALQDKGLSSYSPHTEHDVDSTLTSRETVTSRGLGFRAGLGCEVKVAGPLSVGVEVFGRTLRLKDWTGEGSIDGRTRVRDWMDGLGWYNDSTSTESIVSSGKWLYTFDFEPSLRYLYTLENMVPESPKAPSSTYFRARDAAIDLGGVGVQLSLRYGF